MKVVAATRNERKLAELRRVLPELDLEPLPAGVELPPEGGRTFAANALIKGRAASAATGRPAVADDSGIVAAALGGEPGVLSARFAGEGAGDEENLALLIERLEDAEDRSVAYVCALAYVEPGAEPVVVEGRCQGALATEPRGERGFGYDPAFVPDDIPGGRTVAELDPEQKDSISHRGRAARALMDRLGRGAAAP